MNETLALKSAYELSRLSFYISRNKYHCRFSTDPDELPPNELTFLLNALAMGQARVFFDDVGVSCVGIDELKSQYYVFILSGLQSKSINNFTHYGYD